MRACPVCSKDLDDLGKRRNAIYCSGTCRARASDIRHGRSRVTTDAQRKRRRRQGGANQRARRTPDLRVSYDKAARHVATVLAGHPLYVGEPLARRLAEEGLRAALTPRQRAALERRGTS